jgi:hypothetical protein
MFKLLAPRRVAANTRPSEKLFELERVLKKNLELAHGKLVAVGTSYNIISGAAKDV